MDHLSLVACFLALGAFTPSRLAPEQDRPAPMSAILLGVAIGHAILLLPPPWSFLLSLALAVSLLRG